ncbi:amidohydrolase family protein [Ekhidna sp.]|uniref:amidohydrolase family protein n=1 Tax=Ekhidna sp. TaxID=2608089 RepID=UPI003CCB9BDF
MKTSLTCFLLVFILVSCIKNQDFEPYDLIITNVNLIDGTGAHLVEGANVYINDRIITKIDSGVIIGEGDEIDGTGKYLIPGLFDCHVHTTDFNRDFPKLMHYGVTSVFIPGGSTCTNEYYAEMRARGNQDSISAPRVFHTSQHFTIEGRHPVRTYVSSNWREGETVFFLKDTAQISKLVKQVSEYPILGIKITIEDGPAPPFVERIPQEFIDKTVTEAKKYDLEVFAHASDNEEFLMAVKSGAQNIIHYVGIDIDWGDDEHAGAVQKLLERDASIVSTLMIDKSFLYPLNPHWMEVTALNEVYPSDTLKKLLTSDAIAFAKRMENLTKMEYGLDSVSLDAVFLPKVEDIQRLLDKGMNMTLGTDTGNDFNFYGYSLHEEMQLMQMGGIDPIDILRMGTLNAAKMMHAEDSLGSIEVGKLADMVLLDENPLANIKNTLEINTVFKSGRIQERINK